MVKRGSKKGMRLHEKTLAKKMAAACELPECLDVAIIGGGASGLACACTACMKNPKLTVAVFEQNDLLGKSILATGNGRCNVSNTKLSPDDYRNASFVAEVFGNEPFEQIKRFFATNGVSLALVDEARGTVFPITNQAEGVRAPLIETIASHGVLAATMREVLAIQRRGDLFEVTYSELFRETATDVATKTVLAKQVVLATNCEAGLAFAKSLKIRVLPYEPALVPLRVSDYCLSGISGERIHAELMLADQNQEVFFSEVGDVMLQGQVISGIPAFNASRMSKMCSEVTLDLFPEYDSAQLSELIPNKLHGHSHVEPNDLIGLITLPVAKALLGSEHMSASQFAKTRKCVRAECVGLDSTRPGQVERGGIGTDEVQPHSLETKALPGVYAVGNLLDVDGPCGGYNLSWCWLSGIRAGEALARA